MASQESSSKAPAANGPGLLGSVLAGRYRVHELVGSGAAGAVYRAEHIYLRRECAIKILNQDVAHLEQVRARFEREALAASRIAHPNVATAMDYGFLEDGLPYLVLEFIQGQTLADRLEAGALSEMDALHIARQLASALAAAHAGGVIHRDLKSENVMLTSHTGQADLVKVLDFGIAKVDLHGYVGDAEVLTRVNTIMGTPSYMAPEQVFGDPVDGTADLYALGVLLYEMLLGTPPFCSADMNSILRRKLTQEAPPLPAPISMGVQVLVARLLRRSPAERPQSAQAVVLHIARLQGAVLAESGQAASATTPPALVRVARPVLVRARRVGHAFQAGLAGLNDWISRRECHARNSVKYLFRRLQATFALLRNGLKLDHK